MSFDDGTFRHVSCIGVIHHSPHTAAIVPEIARVLKPGGTAAISVYNRNVALRMWPVIQPLAGAFGRLGVTLKGRGRERMMRAKSSSELVSAL